MTDPLPTFSPPRADLDDLVLLRRGFYGSDARLRPLPLPDDVRQNAIAAGGLVVVDPEGVPVVRLEGLDDAGGGTVAGRPQWLGWPSSRPFEELHPAEPVDLTGRPVLLVDNPSDVPDEVPAGAVVLALVSTSLDGPSEAVDTVRAALAATGDRARVLVLPLPPGDPGRRRALLTTLGVDDARAASDAAPAPDGSPDGLGGVVLFLTGFSGSGKSTVARAVSTRLVEDGRALTLLDGDVVRRSLTAGLGFSPADRRTNVLRIGWVAAEVAHHGGIAVCSPIAPEDEVRRQVAERVRERGGRFVLVHVATPIEECERRDRKGLYAAARRGEIPDFTGVSAPYDVPADPDLRLDTTGRDVAGCADEVLALLRPTDGTHRA
ncbi:adenylyl-sulfate kinase [Phycicoccus mangrovi]|uniref:adenylyl-sulfate kinase n=1 Tax=Phycicoccus mangrovi TaxID=2840470 RepID=UPI0027E37CA5|nr:adenylyl-sulfate kinase [Phycicoccus mangrovi]